MDKRDVERMLRLKRELEEREKYSGFGRWFKDDGPFSIHVLEKHRAFFDAGAIYRERLLQGGNRCGKTISGAYETAVHLTGKYPQWWRGKRFEKPPQAWAMGSTSLTTRDTVQQELMGSVGAIGTGMIPRDAILRTTAKPGTPNGISDVLVKHVNGVSRLSMMSYEQGCEAFYGRTMDLVWQDEEPPQEVYTECLVRLMTTNGIMYVTCTPLNGTTPFISAYARYADHLKDAVRVYVPDDTPDTGASAYGH
jgi:phage terminase large subunit-like protein